MRKEKDPLLGKIHLEAFLTRGRGKYRGHIVIHYGMRKISEIFTAYDYTNKEIAAYQLKRIIKLIRIADWHDIVDEVDDTRYLTRDMESKND